MKPRPRSEALFREAQRYLPGGVDSPVRAFKAVGGTPPFIARGQGSRVRDVDGNEYIDYVGSWGLLIAGHAHPAVVKALQAVAEKGMSYGAPTELEVTLAKMVTGAVPSMQMVRFVNSGTEATMSALRLARAFTRRDKIVKFAGGYHGHADGLLVKGGSGLATLGIPDSPGVPAGYAQNTLVAPYNDLDAVAEILRGYNSDIAAVIVEPVAANMGLVLPQQGFLQGLRKITTDNGALLIFDEVITGFRAGYGGAQGLYRVTPDLTCLGKIIGGGLPVGAYGGRRDIMAMVAPSGKVYQAGTLSGNPLAMTAGIETLKILNQPGAYEQLEERASTLAKGIEAVVAEYGIPARVNHLASMLTLFFARQSVTDYESAAKSDTEMFARFFHALLDTGIYWPCAQFETAFVSLAHTPGDIETTIERVRSALNQSKV